jgi:hypothetical protein
MRNRLALLTLICGIFLMGGDCHAQQFGFEEERPTTLFEVSKIGPLPPYSKAKFAEIWKGFREQYGIRDGIFVKWYWSKRWLRNGGKKPEFDKATFEVVSGLDASGKPTGDRIIVKQISHSESKAGNLDQDVRGRRRGESSGAGYSFTMVLVDPTQPKSSKFSCDYEYDEDESTADKTVYYEIGTLADTPLNQTRFVEALKAGSEFRVILPKEIACRACGGIGRPSGSRSMLAKCRECGGSGKEQTIEVFLVKW